MSLDLKKVLRLAPSSLVEEGASLAVDDLFDEVLPYLPAEIVEAVNAASPKAARHALAQSIVVALSSIMLNVNGRYGGLAYSPHHFVLITGPAGAGKGIIRHGVRTAEEAARIIAKAANPDRGDVETIIVSANASDRGFFDVMTQTGGTAFVVATEVDELVGTRRNEWAGMMSPMLRMGYEHERIQVVRKEFRASVDYPRIACLLSGTPDQIERLFPSMQDGLFSRFEQGSVPPDESWRTPRPTREVEALDLAIDQISQHAVTIAEDQVRREEPLIVSMTDDQWDFLDDTFGALKKGLAAGPLGEMAASVHRHGSMAFRIAMVLTVLRRAHGLSTCGSQITVLDEDVMAAVMMAMLSLRNGLDVYMLVDAGRTPGIAEAGAMRLYEALPVYAYDFTRQEAVRTGQELGLSPRTVDSYLKVLVGLGYLARVPGANGKYKPQKRIL